MSDEAIKFDLEEAAPESWQRRVRVEVSEERLETARTDVIKSLRKKVTLPGFRKGHVPADVVRKRFAAEVEQETLERIIPQAYTEFLQAHNDLQPVAEPRVENLAADEGPLAFDLTLEVRPKVSLADYRGLEAERVVVPITDDRVDQAVEELAERHAQWAPVTRQAREGDALKISYAPLTDEGDPDEEQRVPEYAMTLGGDGVLPEFNSALEGLQPGEDTRVEVEYPGDYPNEELAGQVVRFHVAILEVLEKRLPALDDDFAESVSKYKTLEELRGIIREELEFSGKRESERMLHEGLIDKILAGNEVQVPPTLEARYLQAILRDLQRASGGQEMDAETQKQLEERYRPAARRAVQRVFVLDHILEAEGLRVGDEDLEARIAELAQKREMSPEDLRRALEAQKAVDRLRHEMEEERVFALLEEHAKVSVVTKEGEPFEGESDGESEAKTQGEASSGDAAQAKE